MTVTFLSVQKHFRGRNSLWTCRTSFASIIGWFWKRHFFLPYLRVYQWKRWLLSLDLSEDWRKWMLVYNWCLLRKKSYTHKVIMLKALLIDENLLHTRTYTKGGIAIENCLIRKFLTLRTNLPGWVLLIKHDNWCYYKGVKLFLRTNHWQVT